MSDLTQFLPQDSETVKAIYAWHKAKGDAEPNRGHLGASAIGDPCDRFLWYQFRGLASEEFGGRKYRLFQTGHLAEPRFVEELRGIGCEVHEVGEDGEQFEANALGGHFSGHCDGVALGVPEAPKTWHLLEMKTHADKSFKGLVKKGLKASKLQHWTQMQAYMGGMGLKRGLYMAVNKNTDELYTVRVHFEPKAYSKILERAKDIIESVQAPERIASRLDDYRCKKRYGVPCPAYTLCWGVTPDGDVPGAAAPIPSKTCRSCCAVTPRTNEEGAVWRCGEFDHETIEDTERGKGCKEHLLLPCLLPSHKVRTADAGFIDFESEDGSDEFRHGGTGYTTEELMAGRPTPLPVALKEEPIELLAAYAWGDSEKAWSGKAGELAGQLERHLGYTAEQLGAMEPHAKQIGDKVNAVEYRLKGGDFLVVLYKADGLAAIWKGKE